MLSKNVIARGPERSEGTPKQSSKVVASVSEAISLGLLHPLRLLPPDLIRGRNDIVRNDTSCQIATLLSVTRNNTPAFSDSRSKVVAASLGVAATTRQRKGEGSS